MAYKIGIRCWGLGEGQIFKNLGPRWTDGLRRCVDIVLPSITKLRFDAWRVEAIQQHIHDSSQLSNQASQSKVSCDLNCDRFGLEAFQKIRKCGVEFFCHHELRHKTHNHLLIRADREVLTSLCCCSCPKGGFYWMSKFLSETRHNPWLRLQLRMVVPLTNQHFNGHT